MASKLQFRLRSVKCLDETTSVNIGSDEIAIAGVAINPDATTGKIPQLKVGTFDKGKVRTFNPPRPFATFNLKNGAGFPKAFAVTLLLAEKDQGGLAKVVDRLPKQITDAVKTKAASALSAAVGGAVGSVAGPVGTVLGALAGTAAVKVFDGVKGALSDDVFPPQTVDQTIKDAARALPASAAREIVTFKGHGGKYEVVGDWHLV
jgi:hypothetical protein